MTAPRNEDSDTQEFLAPKSPGKHASNHPKVASGFENFAGSVPATGSAYIDQSHSSPEDDHSFAVIGSSIQVNGDQGPAYGPLDVRIPAKGLTILSGRGGSGRTALALTISGRMTIDEGYLQVLGEEDPKQIRKRVAIAGVEEIDAIDRNVRVREVFTEHKVWSSLWISWQRPANEEYAEELCREIYGSRDLPPLDVYVSQISGLDRILIRICLALHPANGEQIDMLVMDDLEQVRELEDRMILLQILERLSHKIPVVVNAVNPLPDDMDLAHTQIELFTDTSHLQPKHKGLRKDKGSAENLEEAAKKSSSKFSKLSHRHHEATTEK